MNNMDHQALLIRVAELENANAELAQQIAELKQKNYDLSVKRIWAKRDERERCADLLAEWADYLAADGDSQRILAYMERGADE